MDALFPEDDLSKGLPLAARLRPRRLDDLAGQDQVVGPGTVLRRQIEQDQVGSSIFWGPPGSGKTTLARIILSQTKRATREISAVTSNVGQLRRLIEEADQNRAATGRGTMILIDEIHRFTKNQQDAVLPAAEDGRIVLIGLTTENPFFEVTSPLLSRTQLFQFEPVADKDMKMVLNNACARLSEGRPEGAVSLSEAAMAKVIDASQGDARKALSLLELLLSAVEKDPGVPITAKQVEKVVRRLGSYHDPRGDDHYDCASAFIKSVRGSDADAALYWLARLIDGGEDPKFIARRMVIAASEDIGLADSQALAVAMAAAQAVQFVGLPEARINLAHAALYLAKAPKSNSAIRGIDEALREVRRGAARVPKHLRDSSYAGAKTLGHGRGYRSPHKRRAEGRDPGYLPSELHGKIFYKPAGEDER